MNSKKIFLLSFIISVLFWSVFTWPLPKKITKGIPASAHNQEKDQTRSMIQGDHLQLLYHFWLLSDMIEGKTPFFTNLYEFNTGNDQERYKFGFYYIPFSLLFAIFKTIGGCAVGWNLTGLLSIILTYYFSVLLARKYTKNLFLAFIAALFSILLPYRWITLLGGSPTGFAMVFVPLVFLGMEKAFSEKSFHGGFMAGIAVLFSYFSDTHVFFFNVLSLPFLCFISLLKNNEKFFNKEIKSIVKNFLRTCLNLMPVFLLTLLSLSLSFFLKKRLVSSMMSGGRTFRELSLFSPKWFGLFSYTNEGISSHIFIGWCFMILVLLGLVIFSSALKSRERKAFFNFTLFIYLLVMILGIVTLSLGVNGPHHGFFLQIIRKLIPPYAMIRQPSKIFGLLPSIMVVISAMSLDRISKVFKNRVSKVYFFIGIIVFMVFEHKNQVSSTICLLNTAQPAYKAVSDNAAAENKNPRAIVLPIWPGDSSWSSIYEYYVSLYRIRMLNGYSPVVRKDYVTEIFEPLQKCNKGDIGLAEIEKLKGMGIEYLILHEDAFPEKVSPFPVCFTLRQMLKNPYLKLIKNSGPVWSFKIVSSGEVQKEDISWNTFFPVRKYEFEKCKGADVNIKENKGKSSGGFVGLNREGAFIETGSFSIPHSNNQKWMIRIKGHGNLRVFFKQDINKVVKKLKIENNDWHYIKIPVKLSDSNHRMGLKIELVEGDIDLDLALFMAGEWKFDSVYDKLELAAPLFFHSGFTDLSKNSVILRKNEINAVPFLLNESKVSDLRRNQYSVFYGPRLPLFPGKYKVSINYTSKSEKNDLLGYAYFHYDDKNRNFHEILAGKEAMTLIDVQNNLPFTLNFIHAGNNDIEIKNVLIEKINENGK